MPQSSGSSQPARRRKPTKHTRKHRTVSPSSHGKDKAEQSAGWDAQADWYDARHGESGDSLHSQVVLPAVLRQLAPQHGDKVFDCCCGQGVFSRLLAKQGVEVVGLDASEELIAKARERAGDRERFLVADARNFGPSMKGQLFDHAAIVLALQDLDPLEPVLAGCRSVIKEGGRLVIALVHPCFRPVRRSGWTWQGDRRSRVVSAYLRPFQEELRTHPGKGAASPVSTAHHRPLQDYCNALGNSGFAVTACEELGSPKRGSKGPQAAEEDRSAREIPMFLILTAVALPV